MKIYDSPGGRAQAHIQSIATRKLEIAIFIAAIAADNETIGIYILAIAADRPAMGIYIEEIAINRAEIATYSREIAADIQEMAANIGEMDSYTCRTAARSLFQRRKPQLLVVDRGFTITYCG